METNKQFVKKLIYLLAVMAVISALGAVICVLSVKNQAKPQENEDRLQVVTSFHPMYILTKNLLKYTKADVTNMTTGLSGCIHDYQVTTEDMRRLSKADVFVANGMGMESFLAGIVRKNPTLTVFVASGDEDTEEHQHGAHEENGHLWMNPHTYLDELNNLHGDFTDYFLEKGDEYALNGLILAYNEYGRQVLALMKSYDELAASLPGEIHVISFNEAFLPFAEGLGMSIIAGFSLDEDEMPSAGDIADAIREAKLHENVVIFIEKDLAYHADKVVAETGAKVIYIDPLTGGSDADDAYLLGMSENINSVKESCKAESSK